MGMTRRTFICTAGVTAAAAALSACGATPAPTPTPAPKGVVVPGLGGSYLAYPETGGTLRFSNCWGGARIPLIEGWIKEFKTVYPNITVENDISDCPKLLDTQVTQLAGGQAPDVVMVQSENFPFLKKSNSLLALDDLVARDKVDPAWFYASEWQARQVDGKIYGLPNVTAGAQFLLFYNTNLLQKVGWDPKKPISTWQDLESLAESAKKAGLFVLDPARLGTGQVALTCFIYSNGGRVWTDDRKTATVNSPEAIEAAEFMLRFSKAQAGKYESLMAAGDPRNNVQVDIWGAEKYIANLQGSWFIFQLASTAPNVKYGISTFPRNANNPNSKGYAFLEGGWAFGIPRIAKNQEAAWEWVKFTTASKYACEFVVAQNRPSPVVSCNADPRLSGASPYWNVVQRSLNEGVVVPLIDTYPQMREIMYEAQDNVLYEKMTPKAAMDAANGKAQKLLDEYNKAAK